MIYPVVDVYTDPAEKGDGSLAQPLQYLFTDLRQHRADSGYGFAAGGGHAAEHPERRL